MIAVFVGGRYIRHVSPGLAAAEVAGRVLPPRVKEWRTATRTERGWEAYYFVPKDEQVKDWENRTHVREGGPLAQRDIAH